MSDTFTTSTDRKSTMGLDHFSKVYDVENKELKLQLWDTGGDYFEFVVYKITSALKIALIPFFANFSQVWREWPASHPATTSILKLPSLFLLLIILIPSTSCHNTF